jgi:hypothetical protein
MDEACRGRKSRFGTEIRVFAPYTLELSPASPNEGLVTVELSRAPDGSTSVASNFQAFVEDRAFELA